MCVSVSVSTSNICFILLLLFEFQCIESSALLNYFAMWNELVDLWEKDIGKVSFATS